MKKNITLQHTDTMAKFHLPRYAQIPNVGLYLEQTTKYINQAAAPLGCAELTGSMVSNYVKKGIVSRPQKKLYDADLIAHLMVITLLKNILSIEEIHTLFCMQEGVYSNETAYDYFCAELENMLLYVFGLREELARVGVTESEEKTILRSAIISLSHRIYLHHCFRSAQEAGL